MVLVMVIMAGCQTTSEIPDSENTYSMVFEFPGMDSVQVFASANDWLVTQFLDASTVIEFSDKEAGIITGKIGADVPLGGWAAVPIDFKMTINTKDERARIKLDGMEKDSDGNFIYEAISSFSRADYDKFTAWADERIGKSFYEYVSSGATDVW